jgi:hypothetical protein
VLELSSNGGQTWSTPLSTAADNVDGYYWFDITQWASANTRMRFRVTDADSRAVFYVDDVEVWYKTTTTARDSFDNVSFSNSNGNDSWASAWSESGDNSSPQSGAILVRQNDCPDSSSRCLELNAAAASTIRPAARSIFRTRSARC